MKPFKNTYTNRFFSSVTEISDTIWHHLNCCNNLYFHPDYLAALEQNNPHILFSYVVILDQEKKPIAFASFQILDFNLNEIENSLAQNNWFHKIQCFWRKLGFLTRVNPVKVLICGNTFVSGEHGVFIKSDQNKQLIIKKIAKSMLRLANSDEVLNKQISIFLIKDFIKESLTITDELHDLNYYSFHVEPNMILKIDENWYGINDYLDAMKTKFRIKAKRAFKLSADLAVLEITPENIEENLHEMTQLYNQVAGKAVFNLGDFNLKSYCNLLKKLPKNYFIYSYWLTGKMVGFMSGLINSRSLDAHFVGIDYSFNKSHAIYQRMLYDYVNLGINKNLKQINFGRTASEIKSSIGAIPQDLTCYIRHKKSIPNHFLKRFLKQIAPTPFKQKRPFKTVQSL